MSGITIRTTTTNGKPLDACPDDHPFRVEVEVPRPADGDPPKTIEITIKSNEDTETLTLAWTGNTRGPARYRSNPITMDNGAEGGGKFTVTIPFTKVSFEKSTGGMDGVETSDGESVSISYGNSSTSITIYDSWHTLTIAQAKKFFDIAEAYWKKIKDELSGVKDDDAKELVELAKIKLGLIERGRQNVNNTRLWDSERAALGSYFANLVRSAGSGYDPRTEFDDIRRVKEQARDRSMEVIWREFKNIVLGFYMLITSATLSAQIFTLFTGKNVLGKKVAFSERVAAAIDLASNAALLAAGVATNLQRMRRKTPSVKTTKVSKGVDPENVAPGTAVDPWDFGVLKHGVRHARRVADKHGVILEVRPANLASMRWQGRGYPRKPEAIKQKTISELDTYIGANKEHIGLVGHFKPKKPTRPSGMDDATWARVQKRYQQRLDGWETYHPKMLEMQKKGKVELKDGLVIDRGLCGNTGKPITGDYDLWAVRDRKTGRLYTADEAKPIVNDLRGGGFDAKHGAHLNWKPKDKAGKAVDQAIRDRHKYNKKSGKHDGESILVIGGRADGPAKTTFSNVKTPLPKVERGSRSTPASKSPTDKKVRPAELQQGVGTAKEGTKQTSKGDSKDDSDEWFSDAWMKESEKRTAEFDKLMGHQDDDDDEDAIEPKKKASAGEKEWFSDEWFDESDKRIAEDESALTADDDKEDVKDKPSIFSSPIAKVMGGVAAFIILGVGGWAIYARGGPRASALMEEATSTPIPATSTSVPTNTPSAQDYLDQIPPQHGITGRQLIQIGMPGADLLALAGFFTKDDPLDHIYSIDTVIPGIISPFVDIEGFLAFVLGFEGGAQDPVFNSSIFECGETGERTVVCTDEVLPMPPGEFVLAVMELGEPLPPPIREQEPGFPVARPGEFQHTYAFVVDTDGDPSNDFMPQGSYNWDYYQGTDTWYELIGNPSSGTWTLIVTDGSMLPLPSTARVVIEGSTISFYISADEFPDLDQTRYRMTAFQTDGSFQPQTSTGDVTGANPTEELLLIRRTEFKVYGPPEDMLFLIEVTPGVEPEVTLDATEASTPPITTTATSTATATATHTSLPTSTHTLIAPATPTVASATPENVEAQAVDFIAAFSQAHEERDIQFLIDHLGNATIERYGLAQCQSYLNDVAGTISEIEVISTTYPVLFNYALDGIETQIPGAVRVNMQLLALGNSTEGSMHVLIEDGWASWFTDCGDPQ